jgi:phage terminase small subunit
MEKKRPLTLKQRKWMREYIRTGNGSEASRRVYNIKNDNVAGVIAYENIRKLKIPFIEMMERAGITDESDVALLLKLRNAQRVQSADVYVQNENGRWVVNENSNDFIEVDDNQVQLKALELTQKLKGRIKEAKNGNGQGNGHFTQVIVKLDSKEATIEDAQRISDGIRVFTNA